MIQYTYSLVCFLWILGIGRIGTAQTLTYQSFLNRVYEEHPIAKKIRLLGSIAKQQRQYAKGNFDPKLEAAWDNKQFENKAYYKMLNTHLKVPTWIGLELETGYNYTNGEYLNPENTLPQTGQAYLGLKLPLLKGLWTDERRIILQKAKVFEKSSAVEIQAALNDLLYDAALSYWEWVGAYNSLIEIKKSLGLAEEQFLRVKVSWQQGDKPAIDTLKSHIRILDRKILLETATLEVQKRQRVVTTFLWEIGEPLELEPASEPVILGNISVVLMDSSRLQESLFSLEKHPKVQKYSFKLQNLELERKLKMNKFLPKLDVKYNFLATEDIAFFGDLRASAPFENYKLGVQLSVPILLRKERASLKINAFKQKEVNYLQDIEKEQLSAKIKNYFATIETKVSQVAKLQVMITSYELLLDAEQLKLKMGESSLFVVNSRENQLLQARLKLIKQQIGYFKAYTSFSWLTMNLDDQIGEK